MGGCYDEFTLLHLHSKKKLLERSLCNKTGKKKQAIKNKIYSINKKIACVCQELNLPEDWTWGTKLYVPKKLATFLRIPSCIEVMLPRNNITCMVDEELERRGLVYNKFVYRTNDTVSDVFGCLESVNNINDYTDLNGFNINTLSKYITYALIDKDTIYDNNDNDDNIVTKRAKIN